MTQTPAPAPSGLGVTNFCSNCNFFEQPPADTTVLQLGRCHYSAPQYPLQAHAQARAIWPLCGSDDWCGQWAAKT